MAQRTNWKREDTSHARPGLATLICASKLAPRLASGVPLNKAHETMAIGLEQPLAVVCWREQITEDILNLAMKMTQEASPPTLQEKRIEPDNNYTDESPATAAVPTHCSACNEELVNTCIGCVGCRKHEIPAEEVRAVCASCHPVNRVIRQKPGKLNTHQDHVVFQDQANKGQTRVATAASPVTRKRKDSSAVPCHCQKKVGCDHCRQCTFCKCDCHKHREWSKLGWRDGEIAKLHDQLVSYKVRVCHQKGQDSTEQKGCWRSPRPLQQVEQWDTSLFNAALLLVLRLPFVDSRLNSLKARQMLLPAGAVEVRSQCDFGSGYRKIGAEKNTKGSLDARWRERNYMTRLVMTKEHAVAMVPGPFLPLAMLEWFKDTTFQLKSSHQEEGAAEGVGSGSGDEGGQEERRGSPQALEGLDLPKNVHPEPLLRSMFQSMRDYDKWEESQKEQTPGQFTTHTGKMCDWTVHIKCKCNQCENDRGRTMRWMCPGRMSRSSVVGVVTLSSHFTEMVHSSVKQRFAEIACLKCKSTAATESVSITHWPPTMVLDVSDVEGIGLAGRKQLMRIDMGEAGHYRLVAALCHRIKKEEELAKDTLGPSDRACATEMVAPGPSPQGHEGDPFGEGDYVRYDEAGNVKTLAKKEELMAPERRAGDNQGAEVTSQDVGEDDMEYKTCVLAHVAEMGLQEKGREKQE